MVRYVKGKIVGGHMVGNGVELVISEHRGMFQSDGVMKLVLDERAARDFIKYFPPEVIDRRLRGKGG